MTPPTDLTYRQRILTVQIFIQEHLDENLSLDRLARIAHFSQYHFHRIFRGMVGESVADYVRRLRLESAALVLKSSDRSIIQVALGAGYGTHEAFTRAFRQRFGVAPSEYRAGMRGVEQPTEVATMNETAPACAVRIEQLPARRLAFMRAVGPYQDVGAVYQRLCAWAGMRGLFRPGTQLMAVYHDDPEVTAPDKLRADCGITVGDDFKGEGEVGVQTIQGGEYAIARYRGPYSGLGAAYRWMFGTWLPQSGREPANAPPYEIYLNSPMDAKPEDLLTDICVALRAR